MDRRRVVYSPRAQRDLRRIEKGAALRILDELELLRTPPWPPGKVKKLRGTDFWRLRAGDFRAIFCLEGKTVVVLRVVSRRDLEKTIPRIDVSALVRWLREQEGE